MKSISIELYAVADAIEADTIEKVTAVLDNTQLNAQDTMLELRKIFAIEERCMRKVSALMRDLDRLRDQH